MERTEKRLNWRQACAILGCGRTHFYALVNAGVLPAWRAPGSKRGLWFHERDCRRLLCESVVTDRRA